MAQGRSFESIEKDVVCSRSQLPWSRFRKVMRAWTDVDKITMHANERDNHTTGKLGSFEKFMLWRQMALVWVLILTVPLLVDLSLKLNETLGSLVSVSAACMCHPYCTVTQHDGKIWSTQEQADSEDPLPAMTTDRNGGLWGACTGGVRVRQACEIVRSADPQLNNFTCTDITVNGAKFATQPCCVDFIKPGKDPFSQLWNARNMYLAGSDVTQLVATLFMMGMIWKALQATRTESGWAKSSKYLFIGWFAPGAIMVILFLIPIHEATSPSKATFELFFRGIFEDQFYSESMLELLAPFATLPMLLRLLRIFQNLFVAMLNAFGPRAFDMGARVYFTFLSAQGIGPMALALLPGIKRGAFQCKLMMPQSSLFGWIVWGVPIFYVPIIAVLMLMALQMLSSSWLTASTVLFGTSQLYPLSMGTGIVKMFPDAVQFRQSAVMKTVLRKATILQVLSALCLVGYAVQMVIKGGMIVDYLKGLLNYKSVIFMVISCAKGYLMTTVLAADSLLHLTFLVHSEEQDSPALAQNMQDTILLGKQTLVPGSAPTGSTPPEIEMGTLAAHSVEALLQDEASSDSHGNRQAALIETHHETI